MNFIFVQLFKKMQNMICTTLFLSETLESILVELQNEVCDG